MYQYVMKKLLILLAFVALGAVTLSCEDASYNEVEQTILEDQTSDPHEDDEEVGSVPGKE